MRRLSGLLFVAVLLAAALPAGARPGAGATAYQIAWGDWVVGAGNHPDWYVAVGLRDADSGGYVENLGLVGVGSCKIERKKNRSSMFCSASGPGKEIPLQDFQVDPAMNSAYLTLKAAGYQHQVTWEGKGDPYVSQSIGGSGGFALVSAGLGRNARPSGKVFGKKLSAKTARSAHGLMWQGGDAYVYSRSLVYDADRNTFEAAVEFRLPR